ncbi:cell surface protein, partial [candidate division WOR-3 bacterium]|nr:cell surface protein [candidate division WOR-3 bacterium]
NGLVALDQSGNLRWQNRLMLSYEPMRLPTLGRDGTIYVAGWDSLYAVHGPAPLADSPWPKFQRDLGNTGRAGP